MSKEMIEELDENNMKALAILNNMLSLLQYEPDSNMDVQHLLEVVTGYINANNEIFKERV